LRSSPLGESDLIVTAYSRERGKVRAVAKGARRSTSKLVGHLEPLTLVRLSMSQGRDLDVVSQAQVLEAFPQLKANLDGIAKGVYVAELIDGFGPEASGNSPLFQLGVDVLGALAADSSQDMALRYFELHLLEVTGLLPELYRCVECQRELEPNSHRFSPNLGGVLCAACNPVDAHVRPLSLRALKVLRMIHRSSINEAAGFPVGEGLSNELKSLLSTTVGYWVGKEIRSNSFWEKLHKEATIDV
jgi:DNA repair protein RecO (recombination protein O)